jgi:hypothetical protein
MFRESCEAGNVKSAGEKHPSVRTEVYEGLGYLAAICGVCMLFGRRSSG